jgi:hypothetical protein
MPVPEVLIVCICNLIVAWVAMSGWKAIDNYFDSQCNVGQKQIVFADLRAPGSWAPVCIQCIDSDSRAVPDSRSRNSGKVCVPRSEAPSILLRIPDTRWYSSLAALALRTSRVDSSQASTHIRGMDHQDRE